MSSLPSEIPFNELFRGRGADDATNRIQEILESLDYDFVSNLYDEALLLAREGHLGRARDRLRMLLTLEPEDGRGHLLLAKVFASQRKWSEAIAELDAAAACGVRLPIGMKDAFETARADAAAAAIPVPDNQSAARAQGEIAALREETRRLRSEKTRVDRALRNARERAQTWTIATTIVTGISLAGLLAFALSGGDSSEAASDVAATTELAAADQADAPTEPGALDLGAALQARSQPMDDLPVESVASGQPAVQSVPVSAPAAAPTPAPVPAPRASADTYTVVSGDNLWIIAKKVYGDSTRWKEIQEANRSTLGEKIALQVGMELRVPGA